MSDFDDGFGFYYYLKSKYPDDYLKFTDEKTPQDVKNSIISKHAREFDIWKEIPYDVLLRWDGNPPEEIMTAAAQGNYRKMQLNAFNIREDEDTYAISYESFVPEPETIMATAAFVVAVERGYSKEASLALAKESMFREQYEDRARNNLLTAAEKEIWRQSRERTRDIIRKDWAENSPEKLLVHIFAKYNRGKISDIELADTTRELMGRIESSGRHEELLKFLSEPRIQKRLTRFDSETLDALSQTILSNIKLTDEQSQAIQSQIASRNMSRAKSAMMEHTSGNLSAKQRLQNIPSTLNRERGS